MYERVATHCKRRLNKHMHVSCQNVTAKRRIVFAQKDRLLNYILKHYGVNSGFMRKKVMNPSFPGHAPPQRHPKSRARGDERGLTGENARANAVSGRALSPVKIKIPVASADMRRHSDTLRGANATTKTRFTGRKQNKRSEFCCLPVVPRKWGLTGEKTHERATRSVGVCSPVPYLAIIVFTSNAPNSSSFPVSPMMFSSISATYSLRPASEGCSFRVQRLALPPLS